MIQKLDTFLNSITMYRLVLYSLLGLAGISLGLSLAGVLSFAPLGMIVSGGVLALVCYGSNYVLAKVLRVPTNTESAAITALILYLILYPSSDWVDLKVTILTGVLAMASKYLLAINKKHIFNPAAVALVVIGLLGSGNALWWAGSAVLLPAVAIFGLMIVRKIRRFHLFFSFLLMSVITIVLTRISSEVNILTLVIESFTSWPLLFFATVMLTEPLTTPPTSKLHVAYGAVVGFLFGIQFHFGSLFSTPELALVIGNIFSYLVSSKQRLVLELKSKQETATEMYEFIFKTDQKLKFQPGQYLEWTVAHSNVDTRGNRRYFTIASSPTENDIHLGVKIGTKNSSSYKKALLQMKKGATLVASQLGGSFTLPKDKNQKLVFIAGGIGITPFRSMIKYLLDLNQRRDITLIYVMPDRHAFAYQELFATAAKKIGLKVILILTRTQEKTQGWKCQTGRMTVEMIRSEIPDFAERGYYLSGPNSMVTAYQKMLKELAIPNSQVTTDYFPGF